MQRVGIVSMGAKLPDRVFENEEWRQYVDTSDEWIRFRTGIEPNLRIVKAVARNLVLLRAFGAGFHWSAALLQF